MTTSLNKVLRNIKEQINLVFKLVNEGADVNAIDAEGDTPLHLAIKIADNSSIVKLLIESGADVHAKNKDGDTPLLTATEFTNNVHILELLIDSSADINVRGFFEKTPLHYSVISSSVNFDVCQFLIDSGAVVNARDNTDRMPLHEAVTKSKVDITIIDLLIKSGADVEAKDYYGETALHIALRYSGFENMGVLKLLLEAGADVNAKNQDGQTPLHSSLLDFYVDVDDLKFLLEAGFNVNDDDNLGETSLTTLIDDLVDDETNDETRVLTTENVKFLIAYCDVNHTDVEKRNILARVLEKHHASVNKEYFYKIILEHIAKLKVLELHIDSRLLDVIEAHDDYRNYFAKCIKELEEAKNTKLDGCWVSFFNLLVDSETKLVKYAGNEKLMKDFEKIVRNFPIYGNKMQDSMLVATESRQLFDAASNTLSYYCPTFDPYHLIIRDTLNVLSEEDWEELSEKEPPASN